MVTSVGNTTLLGMETPGWAAFFEEAGESHVALVYRDPSFLAETVALWSARPLREGGGAVLVGTPSHAQDTRQRLRELGLDVDAAERAGRLVHVDAEWLMGHFIIDGSPQASKFRALCDDIVRGVRKKAAPGTSVRAWGEMVSILRLRGNPRAAIRLEELWNDVIKEHGIALLCSYDVAHADASDAGLLAQIAQGHGQLILQPEPHVLGKAAAEGG